MIQCIILIYKGISILTYAIMMFFVSFIRHLRVEFKADNSCIIRSPAIEFSREMNAPDYSIITYVSEQLLIECFSEKTSIIGIHCVLQDGRRLLIS